MNQTDHYIDLDGQTISLAQLESAERQLIARLRRRARANPDWDDFDNYWTRAVPAFYESRGLSRKNCARTVGWRIAQDLSSRLGIAAGLIREPDYRDQLEKLVLFRFPSRRAFCKATGISEDLLSHVLAGRKDLSLATLTRALAKIGYTLRITPAPAPARKRTG
jgi:hypothetical protein